MNSQDLRAYGCCLVFYSILINSPIFIITLTDVQSTIAQDFWGIVSILLVDCNVILLFLVSLGKIQRLAALFIPILFLSFYAFAGLFYETIFQKITNWGYYYALAVVFMNTFLQHAVVVRIITRSVNLENYFGRTTQRIAIISTIVLSVAIPSVCLIESLTYFEELKLYIWINYGCIILLLALCASIMSLFRSEEEPVQNESKCFKLFQAILILAILIYLPSAVYFEILGFQKILEGASPGLFFSAYQFLIFNFIILAWAIFPLALVVGCALIGFTVYYMYLLFTEGFQMFSRPIDEENSSVASEALINPNPQPAVRRQSVIRVDYKKCKQVKCPICWEEYLKEDTLLAVKGCNHVFHARCLQVWQQENDTCPMCRVKLKPSNHIE